MRVGECSKVARGPDGRIVGAAGESTFCDEFLAAVRAGKDDEWNPDGLRPKDFEALMAMPDGSAWVVSSKGKSRVNGEYFAIGMAYEFLYGALAHGASAAEAVALAIAHTRTAGGKVEIVALADTPPTP